MKKLLSSATKVVFIMVALSACIGFFVGRLAPDQFMILATGAFSFYFAFKGDGSQPYAGK